MHRYLALHIIERPRHKHTSVLYPAIDSARPGIDNAPMCRSIKKLRDAEPPTTDDDIRAAALQYVRKVSGYRVPAKRNEAVFEAAVDEVATATSRLLALLDAR